MSGKNRVGRKAEIEGKSKNKLIYAKISEDELKEIEELAKKMDIPKMTLTRNLILLGLRDVKLLDNVGLLKGYKKTSEFINKFIGIKEEK